MSYLHAASKMFRINGNTEIATGAASVQSTALTAGASAIRLACTSACRIAIGTNPTATATSMLLMPGEGEYFLVNGGEKVAAIQETAVGKLSIVEVQS